MEDSLFEKCSVCHADLRGSEIPKEYRKEDTTEPQYYSRLIGMEYPLIYDGTLFYECPVCESRFHRFRQGTDLWRKAEPFVRKLDPPLPRIPDPGPKERVLLHDDLTLVNVHSAATCAGDYCSIHNPSDHPLKERPRIFQDGVILRICQHGEAHPDPDALAWIDRTMGPEYVSIHAQHACCGAVCCR